MPLNRRASRRERRACRSPARRKPRPARNGHLVRLYCSRERFRWANTRNLEKPTRPYSRSVDRAFRDRPNRRRETHKNWYRLALARPLTRDLARISRQGASQPAPFSRERRRGASARNAAPDRLSRRPARKNPFDIFGTWGRSGNTPLPSKTETGCNGIFWPNE